MIQKVSVIGLGKLGACVAAALAHKGFEVFAYDKDPAVVERVRTASPDSPEPRLAELLASPRIHAGEEFTLEECVARSEVSLVIVPTPSMYDGSFSDDYVIEAVAVIGQAIRNKEGRHTVVVMSTVMPGTIDGDVRNVLEECAERKVGPNLGLAYSPQFIALGSVINDLLHPSVLLVGACDQRSHDDVCEVIYGLSIYECPINSVTPTEAEIAKLALNAYITFKISFANSVAEMCEGIDKSDARNVLYAVGSDPRVGKKYLHPGGPYAGPCFPRDGAAFDRFALSCKAPNGFARAAAAVNDNVARRIAKKAKELGGPVGILGLAYKVDTVVTENSLGMQLMRLLDYGPVYDPLVKYPHNRTITAQQCVDQCATVIITQPIPEFCAVNYGNVNVIDVWGMFRNSASRPLKLYMPGIRDWEIGGARGQEQTADSAEAKP